jgi:hypothetical protein
MTTEREMLDRLNVRYGIQFRNGSYIGRRYTRAEQVPTAPGRWGGHRSADFIAIDQHATAHKDLTPPEQEGYNWDGRQSIHVFEVKVSRSDLSHELQQPEKAEAWAQYAHYFWLVIPDVKLMAGFDIPDSWGVLVSHGPRTLRQVKKPTRRTPLLMPMPVVAGLVRAAAKTEVRLELEAYRKAMAGE